jgi:WG containing repeat
MKGNLITCLGNIPEKLLEIDESGMSECTRTHFGLIEKGIESSVKKSSFTSNLVTINESQLVPYRKGEAWGFSNARGEIMIPPQYEGATLFEKNPHLCYSFAIVSLRALMGVIDVEGEYIVRPEYQKVHALNRGGFIAQKMPTDNWVYITEDGIVEETFTHETAEDPIFKRYAGKAIIEPKNKGKYAFNEFIVPQFIRNDSAEIGYVLRKKTILNKLTGAFKLETLDSIPPQYSELKYLSGINFDTLLAKNKEGKWGIINAKNDTLVAFVYDDIKKDIFITVDKDSLKKTYLIAKKNGKWGVCSMDDLSLVLDYDFDEVEIFWLNPLNSLGGENNRLFMKVRRGDYWGLVGERLWQWVVPIEFDDVRLDANTENGFQLIRGQQMGYYIIPAEKTIPPRYHEVKYFKHGFAEVITTQNKAGFINENGDEYFLD